MNEWKDKIVLREGERLKHAGSTSKGFLQETDVDTYEIVSASGENVGIVTVEDHTAVRGFRRTISLRQEDAAGQTILNETWVV